MSSPEQLEPELPVTADSVLWRVSMELWIASLTKRQGERLLREMGEKLAGEANLASVFQLRPSARAAEIRRAHLQAAALYERMLPLFLARVSRR